MGRKKLKTTATVFYIARDIGKLLTGTTQLKRLSLPKGRPTRTQRTLRSVNPATHQPPACPPTSALSTKQDIANLYDRTRKLFDANIALVKEPTQSHYTCTVAAGGHPAF
ncbi:Hypothetical predicted protein [Pelobates cultripes]|uniref:Uncharacterized protein n=1 Tax=Pelobates cultripes TaxID=61616 RepID=A0AAD1SD81_PELCU|nr:Hypothetical predicted protein [Pelobates cultripes]